VVDQVTGGGDVEDDRVELKREWPSDHRRAARQIAGQANAARSDSILWIVGLDESAHRVVGATEQELSNWWPKVERCFSEIAPGLASLRVPTPNGSTVTALYFETDRTPYMITTSGQTAAEREIPWRSGNRTRSATRSEILRSVVAESAVPQLEATAAILRLTHESPLEDQPTYGEVGHPEQLRLTGSVDFYVDAGEPVTLPEHRWSCEVSFGRSGPWRSVQVTFRGPRARVGSTASGHAKYEPRGLIEVVPRSGIHVSGSDAMTMQVDEAMDLSLRRALTRVRACSVRVRMAVSRSSRVVAAELKLVQYIDGNDRDAHGRWLNSWALDDRPGPG